MIPWREREAQKHREVAIQRTFHRPLQKPLQNRVPIEVWEIILNFLYPSQLSRMSMVNKNLNTIISTLVVWSRMFHIAYGLNTQLRLLVRSPSSESSYMIFMCASSLHVCERCFGLTKYDENELYKLPLLILVLLPRRSSGTVKFVGDRYDPKWTVRLCLTCRQGHLSALEEPLPRHISNGAVDWVLFCHKYPCSIGVPRLQPYMRDKLVILEATALLRMREHYGGDIAMKYFDTSIEAYHERTESRIRWYQLQE